MGRRARARARPQAIEVHLCRSKEMLERAKRLRYEVYCEELGRQSPYADHDKKVITDRLDDTGHVFIAVEAGETIGTLRGNASADTELGAMEELYGMRRSPHHPEATSICTKFIVRKSKRGGAAEELIAAMVRYGIRNWIKECYIDCIPALLPYYKALGFKIAGQKFIPRTAFPPDEAGPRQARRGAQPRRRNGSISEPYRAGPGHPTGRPSARIRDWPLRLKQPCSPRRKCSPSC